MSGRAILSVVMAGLPHGFHEAKTWMSGTRPGTTN
jgi:hypothetical protein